MPKSTTSPLVSVLMSTFNRRDLLPLAIRSIKKQSYADWELIIVNDGGCDVTSITNSFFDKRIRLINFEHNQGKPAAINEAFKISKGDYVAYLDDDDQWLPHHLESHMVYYQANPDARFTHSDTHRVVVKQDHAGGYKELERHRLYSKPTSFREMIHKNEITWLSVVHSRECFEAVGGMDTRLRALVDYDLWRRMFALFIPHHIPIHTGDYFIHRQKDGQITGMVAKDPARYFFYNALIKRKRVPSQMFELFAAELKKSRLAASIDFLKARSEFFAQEGNDRRHRFCQRVMNGIQQRLKALDMSN